MYRTSCFSFYRWCKSLIAPTLRYSQDIYEEYLWSTCKPDCRWLDLGCGTRILPPWRSESETALVNRPQMIVGLDYDMDSLKRNHTIHELVRGDISSLPFHDGAFDVVTANMVFEHIGNPSAQLSEIMRVLKPGGVLLFHTPNKWNYATLLARCIPERIKARLVYFLEGRREEDVFRAYYRINSRGTVMRIAQNVGFYVAEIRLIVSEAKLIMLPPFAVLELLWIRLLMTSGLRGLRPNMLVRLVKP